MSAIKHSIRRRAEFVVYSAVSRALPQSSLTPPREYWLAVAEYERRRTDPLQQPELAAHELCVSSQHGEDGVIQEILRRVGTSPTPFFVEFGIGDGHEGNAVLLADALGWAGVFFEPDTWAYEGLARKYKHRSVRARNTFVTPDNAERLFSENGVPDEPDLLSIDIDGDDYYVWSALESYRPRVVVIEYNAGLPSDESLVQQQGIKWDGSDYFGASIGALVALAKHKGYQLVHTETAGINAFFVREDLPGEWLPSRLAGPNYSLQSRAHPRDEQDREYITP